MAPAETALLAALMTIIVLSAWACGGMPDSVHLALVAVPLLGCLALRLDRADLRRLRWRVFLPLAVWVAFVGLAVLNPSHVANPNGGWLPRPEWVRWLPTTADPSHTIADARLWFAALLTGALTCALLRTPQATRWLWGMLAVNGCAVALLGAALHFGGATQVLGLIEPPEPTYFFGPFFYKNHWAAYGVLTATAAFVLALRAWPATLANDPRARGQFCFFTAAGLLTVITLPLPGSRSGALFSLVLGTAFFVELIRIARQAKSGRGFTLLVAAVALFVVGFGAHAYAPRATSDLIRTRRQLMHGLDGEALDLRLQVSRDTWRMARVRPWFGWGPGCYEIVFPVFQGDYLRAPNGQSQARFEFAHNDWLQLLAENGALGALVLVVPAFWAAMSGWRRADPTGRRALAGCALVAAYAWFDFPFHNPAVLLAWTILLTSAHRLRTLPGAVPQSFGSA